MNYCELRVGNHVYINGEEEALTAADLLSLSPSSRFPVDADAVTPIFLSEKLLLRLGFRVEFDVAPYRVYSLGDVFLRSNENRTFNLYVGQQTVGRPIAYLHQLQNLYLVLAGKELL